MNKDNIKPSEVSDALLAELQGIDLEAQYAEVGTTLQVSDGVVRIYGLRNAEANELLEFENGIKAVVMNLEEDNVGAVLSALCLGDGVALNAVADPAPRLVGAVFLGDHRHSLGHHERRVEFAFEGGMRYMDIRRWKEAEKVFETPISGMNTDAKTNNDFFKRTEIQKRIFLKKMYLWPIYQTYLDNNEKMVQNKYW